MITKQQLQEMYWQQGLTLQEIADKLSWSYSKLYRKFRAEYGIETHRTLWQQLQFTDKKLRLCLVDKHYNMHKRVSGEDDPYNTHRGKSVMDQYEYIKLCNSSKEHILQLWQQYLNNDKQLKYAISADRIDNKLGYTAHNTQFVTHGFNSWKDGLKPIKIKKNQFTYYFSSCAEASRCFNCRSDDLREPLRNEKYNRQNVEIEPISIGQLLLHHNCVDLLDYYNNCFIER